jgi:hypothetical protein
MKETTAPVRLRVESPRKSYWTAGVLVGLALLLPVAGIFLTKARAIKPLRLGKALAPPQQVPLSADQLYGRLAISAVVIQTKEFGGTGQGSGIVLADGRVVTNYHVVEAATDIVVQRGTEIHRVDLERIRVDDERDLAVMEVPGVEGPSVVLRPLSDLRVGERVVALGAPQGLELTLSEGIISALRTDERKTDIQTTAPISPGSSGGGLFDDKGNLIGITTKKNVTVEAGNFAVPAQYVEALISGERGVLLSGTPSPDRERSLALAIFRPRMETAAQDIFQLSHQARRYVAGCYGQATVGASGGTSTGSGSSTVVGEREEAAAVFGNSPIRMLIGAGRSSLAWRADDEWRQSWSALTLVSNETTPECRILASDIGFLYARIGALMADGEREATERGVSRFVADDVTKELQERLW